MTILSNHGENTNKNWKETEIIEQKLELVVTLPYEKRDRRKIYKDDDKAGGAPGRGVRDTLHRQHAHHEHLQPGRYLFRG